MSESLAQKEAPICLFHYCDENRNMTDSTDTTNNFTSNSCNEHYLSHNPASTGQQLATTVMAYSMLGLCLWGLYGNLVCALIFSHRSMRSSINVLLMGLSGLDSVILLLSIPSFIVPALNEFKPVPYWGCLYPLVIRFVYPLVMTAQTASVWTFVVISTERYIAVCRPFDVLNAMSRRKAATAQILVILSSFAYNAIRFWEYQTTNQWPWFTALLRSDPYYFSVFYTGFYLAFNFLLPFTIISILNIRIANSVQHVGSRQKNTIIRSTTSPRQSEYRTTRMIFVVTIMFAVCNTPAYLINIWESLDKHTFSDGHFIAFLLSDVATCLVLINSATTLVIYLIFCRRFREFFFTFHSCGYLNYKLDRRGKTTTDKIRHRGTASLRQRSVDSKDCGRSSLLINASSSERLKSTRIPSTNKSYLFRHSVQRNIGSKNNAKNGHLSGIRTTDLEENAKLSANNRKLLSHEVMDGRSLEDSYKTYKRLHYL